MRKKNITHTRHTTCFRWQSILGTALFSLRYRGSRFRSFSPAFHCHDGFSDDIERFEAAWAEWWCRLRRDTLIRYAFRYYADGDDMPADTITPRRHRQTLLRAHADYDIYFQMIRRRWVDIDMIAEIWCRKDAAEPSSHLPSYDDIIEYGRRRRRHYAADAIIIINIMLTLPPDTDTTADADARQMPRTAPRLFSMMPFSAFSSHFASLRLPLYIEWWRTRRHWWLRFWYHWYLRGLSV